ncbi:endonuclease/exonuclease/phosphatase family protein [Sphingobacterium hungaricum]|uniref:Endonuclease n=1 Tax=Sphingobacterium hungaricum TaxID=2082723 RepID=A0A928UYS6_9SPHI|nr:endonuclease/exonuclease/phosphatase family protein [Sphingobacterium hungaricum]MBE8714528.1 endonuclease [Sphingobacterium hungaricum]
MKNLKILTFVLLQFFVLSSFAQTSLHIASYNIRNDNQGDAEKGNGWKSRLPVIAQLIQFNDFDVFGAQEVLNNQLNDLLQHLPQYAHVGVGRDDGKTKGEYAPIFYNKNRFKIVQEGNFWLSETTDRPNKGWDAVLPRICSYAKFEELDNGKTFWVFNLHLDHVGIIAREKSCELVLSQIKKIAGNETSLLMGDFNVDQNNKIYEILNKSGLLHDSYEISPLKYALNGTFNAFDPNLMTDSRIDHIFVTSNVKVQSYAVLTDSYRSPQAVEAEIKKGDFPKELSFKDYTARLPSDHFPVAVKIEIH